MWKRLCLLILVVLPLHVTSVAYADNNELDELQGRLGEQWTLIRHDRLRSIKTYAKQEDGKRFRSFKVEAIMNTEPETIVRVMLDFDSYKKWWWEVRDSRLIRKDSPTEYFVYMVHRAPYGLPDRDVILHAKISLKSRERDFVTLTVRSAPDLLPPKPPLVRMVAEDMIVRFIELPDNKIQMEAQGYVDPGGHVPSWANNLIQRSAPYSIMLGLQRMIQMDEYRQSRTPIPFSLDSSTE